jgi:Na+-driven multidrug efflux pump
MKDLTRGNTVKTFILFAIPLVLGGVLSQGYNLIDTIIAGKLLGEEGLAAIGATSSFIVLISSAFWGFGGGFAVYIAQLYGAKKFKEIKNCIISGFLFMSAVMLLCSVLMIICYRPIFDLLKIDIDIRAEAFSYFAMYMGGFFLIILNNFGFSIMNAFGESSYPFFMSIISALINILGNIITVAVFNMGTVGIAASSVFAAAVVDICYIFRLSGCFNKLGLRGTKAEISIKYIRLSLPFSGPNTFQQLVLYIAGVVASAIINGMGAAATAGFIVVTRVYDFCAQIYHNSAKTISNYTAQCVGAGKTDKIRRGVGIGILQGLFFVLPVLIVCFIIPDKVCSLFFEEGADGEAINIAVTFTRYYLPFVLFQLICNLFHSLFRAVKSISHLFISTIIGAVSRIVLTFIMAELAGMNGVFIAWVLSWVIEAIYSLIIFSGKSWLRNVD